jgi:hypothetical protein
MLTLTNLERLLQLLAPLFVVVAALHLALGLDADMMLGAEVPLEALNEPSLSSQNRFYGVAFSLYGGILWICARDLIAFAAFFKMTMWCFLAGGVARIVAWMQFGAPAPLVVLLMVVELLVPPALLWWHAHARQHASE